MEKALLNLEEVFIFASELPKELQKAQSLELMWVFSVWTCFSHRN